MNRRHFLQSAAAVSASSALMSPVLQAAGQAGAAAPQVFPSTGKPRFQFAVKWGMISEPGMSVLDKFRMMKELGYDGVEMDSQFAVPAKEIIAARDATGLPVHGVVNANHWSVRLSDPTAEIRAKAVDELQQGIRYAHAVGASTILLVPGAVRDPKNENKEQVRERSMEGIRQVLPLAAELGVRIAIENVWNGFLYQHGDGAPADQTADDFVRYVDEISSPWIGLYFDIGNHRKYGLPQEWARTMGTRIVKCDCKDYRVAGDADEAAGRKEGFCDIGDGSVDWAATRQALAGINFFGWVTAEVGGGNRERMADLLARMRRTMLGA